MLARQVLALTVATMRTGLSARAAAVMAVGVSSTGHTLFEIIEYRLYAAGNAPLGLTLADTLSDLGWGIVGSLLGACLALLCLAVGVRRVRETTRRSE